MVIFFWSGAGAGAVAGAGAGAGAGLHLSAPHPGDIGHPGILCYPRVVDDHLHLVEVLPVLLQLPRQHKAVPVAVGAALGEARGRPGAGGSLLQQPCGGGQETCAGAGVGTVAGTATSAHQRLIC